VRSLAGAEVEASASAAAARSFERMPARLEGSCVQVTPARARASVLKAASKMQPFTSQPWPVSSLGYSDVACNH
jgi:hypothetical protein